MIKLVTPETEAEFLSRFALHPYFGIRTEVCLRHLRGLWPNDGYWLAPGGAISRIDDLITVVADDDFDFEQAGRFISMIGGRYVLAPSETALALMPYLPAERYLEGRVMRHVPAAPLAVQHPQRITLSPRSDDVFHLLTHCDARIMINPNFEAWHWWMSLKTRRGFSVTSGIYEGEQLVSTASAVWIGSQHAILGSVATAQEYRNRGFAGELVSDMTNRLEAMGRTAWLTTGGHLLSDEPFSYEDFGPWRLYRSLGYEDAGFYGDIKLEQ